MDQFLAVYNPPNAEPLVLERVPTEAEARPGGSVAWVHTKALYRLTDESMRILRGCTADMCVTDIMPRSKPSPSSSISGTGGVAGEGHGDGQTVVLPSSAGSSPGNVAAGTEVHQTLYSTSGSGHN